MRGTDFDGAFRVMGWFIAFLLVVLFGAGVLLGWWLA